MERVSNISFASRCPQIRDAQWVCRTITSQFPHTSSSKFLPQYKSLLEEFSSNLNIKTSDSPKTLADVYNFINKLQNFIEHLNIFSKDLLPKKYRDATLTLEKIKTNIDALHNARFNVNKSSDLTKCLTLVKDYKVGNCYEDAKIAEFILRLNGIKNACTALMMQSGKSLDHAVCVFNRDGSVFSGDIKNSTIIIDPWAGKADFAKNMFVDYKNNFNRYFDINAKKDIDLYIDDYILLDDIQLNLFKETYPKLIFKNSKRKFMQK